MKIEVAHVADAIMPQRYHRAMNFVLHRLKMAWHARWNKYSEFGAVESSVFHALLALQEVANIVQDSRSQAAGITCGYRCLMCASAKLRGQSAVREK